ncbi:MAG: ATPase, T2SS/T4P/T4SS family [Candidatus Cloacimonadota bacterium]|nr:ATPase, T2SS/T4P/T4SS family [Candidatus Cloacimonadota bacterium]
MQLTFIKEIEKNLTEFMRGGERIRLIDNILSKEKSWIEESGEKIKVLLEKMRLLNASDIDIGGSNSDSKIWFRIHGIKSPNYDLPQFSDDEITCLLLSILSEQQKKILYEKKNIDFSVGLQFPGDEKMSRFRGDVYFESNLLVANFRRINQELFPISSLEFPEMIIKRLNLTNEKSGLILITGITGSGKSTTLDSIVNMNNETNKAHIVIISNPIEYIHKSKKCIIRHREVGTDVLSFREGTIQALRQDPDIVVVGEMRDAETIATVLEVTDSGHKVFSTLHTSSSVESIHRIIAEFPPKEQTRIRFRLADTLKLVISQKLIPTLDGKLTMAKEILSVTNSVKAAIKNNNISEIFQMLSEGKKHGMFTLQQDLFRLVKKGKISSKIAMDYSNNKKLMLQLLKY